jgi:molecular chaperone DnaK (HSP70)
VALSTAKKAASGSGKLSTALSKERAVPSLATILGKTVKGAKKLTPGNIAKTIKKYQAVKVAKQTKQTRELIIKDIRQFIKDNAGNISDAELKKLQRKIKALKQAKRPRTTFATPK